MQRPIYPFSEHRGFLLSVCVYARVHVRVPVSWMWMVQDEADACVPMCMEARDYPWVLFLRSPPPCLRDRLRPAASELARLGA